MRVFALHNIKGGVGKTASAVNLAFLSAAEGARTLLWDLDTQAAASYFFRAEPRRKKGNRRLIDGEVAIDELITATDFPLLDVLPADFSCRKLDRALAEREQPTQRIASVLRGLSDSYQHVFLDCPPGLSLLAENVFEAADALLAPTIPTTLSLRTLAQLMRHFKERDGRRVRALPFLCMVDRRRALHAETCDWVFSQPLGFLRAQIPYSAQVEQMGPRRTPLCAFSPGSAPAQAYEALWHEVFDRVSTSASGAKAHSA